MNWVPLTSESPSFAASCTGSRPTRASASAPGEPFALDPRLALADERQREMRQRRKVAGGADRATARHDRQDASVEEREEQLDGLDASARVPLRERVRAEEHRRADDLGRIRVADAARVGAEQPQLQLGGLLLRDRDGHEAAEAGVDAVGVLAAPVRGALDELAGSAHPLPGLVGQLGAGSVDGHSPDVVNGQVVAREADRRPLRHDASLGRRSLRPLPYVPPGGFATPCRHAIGAGVTRSSRLGRDFVAQSPSPASPRGAAARARATGSSPATPSSEPAAATAAPAGSSPTSSDPVTRRPLAAASRSHRRHDLVQRRLPPVLDVEAHLDVPGARQAEPERADAREAAVALAHRTRHLTCAVEVVACEVDVEGDQRRAALRSARRPPLVELRRAEIRSELSRVDAPLQLGGAATTEERGPAAAARSA